MDMRARDWILVTCSASSILGKERVGVTRSTCTGRCNLEAPVPPCEPRIPPPITTTHLLVQELAVSHGSAHAAAPERLNARGGAVQFQLCHPPPGPPAPPQPLNQHGPLSEVRPIVLCALACHVP